jgi:hypothetical protein
MRSEIVTRTPLPAARRQHFRFPDDMKNTSAINVLRENADALARR